MSEAEDRRIRRLVAVHALTGFTATLVARVPDPMVAEIGADLARPATTVALLASFYALPFALVQPFLGPIGDALGKRRVILVCQFLFGALVLASAFAPDFATLAVLRGLSGAAGGGIFPLMLALFGDEVPLARRQVAISRLLFFSILGQIAGGAVAAGLEPLLGWRGVIAACGLLALAAALILLIGRGGPEPLRPFRPADALARYRRLVRLPQARVLYAAVAINGGLALGLAPYLAPLLMGRAAGGTAEAGLTLAAFGAGGLIYATLVGWMLPRLGQAGILRLGGALGAAGMLTLIGAGQIWALLVAGLLLGTGYTMVHSTIQVRASEIAPDARGAAMSLHAFSFFTGQFLGPIVYGTALGVVGVAATLGAAGCGLFALAVWLAGRRGP